MTTLKLKTNKEPTFWNEDIWTGMGAGAFIPLVGPFFGAIIGGFVGKKRMNDDLEDGKTVSEASYFNKGILQGGAKGAIIGSILGGLTSAAIIGTQIVPTVSPLIAGGLSAASALTITGLMPLAVGAVAIGLGVYLTSLVVGAISGSISKHHQQDAEFKEAQEQERGQMLERSRSQEIEKGMNNPTLSKDVSSSLDLENAINYRSDFAQNELARRSQSPKQIAI